ncbi:MAG: DNA replication/repair protein RecF, partial [Candidatus Latescibacteria bacterium]|nr:DNA replication/repair protein RecF [Candidatus Latescibacterota bacterium]
FHTPLLAAGYFITHYSLLIAMFLSTLDLHHFRNYVRERLVFSPKGVLIRGGNAQGKSNLLEAIYFLSLGKSSRGAAEADVASYDQRGFGVRGEFSGDKGSFSIFVEYDAVRGKRIVIDGQALPRASLLVGRFPSVLFSPEDVDLILRFPVGRRRILDALLSQESREYLSDLLRYRRVLTQRNRLLKRITRVGAEADRLLGPWDEELAACGARIVRRRMEMIEKLRDDFVPFYRKLASGGEEASFTYEHTVSFDREDHDAQCFMEALARKRSGEIRMGYTLSGPHRDDVRICVNGRDLQRFGSQGQLKSVLLAWKLAEVVFLKRASKQWPALLLDDVFSELDRRRCLVLLELLSEFGQVFLTAAREEDLPLSEMGFDEVVIEKGTCIRPTRPGSAADVEQITR